MNILFHVVILLAIPQVADTPDAHAPASPAPPGSHCRPYCVESYRYETVIQYEEVKYKVRKPHLNPATVQTKVDVHPLECRVDAVAASRPAVVPECSPCTLTKDFSAVTVGIEQHALPVPVERCREVCWQTCCGCVVCRGERVADVGEARIRHAVPCDVGLPTSEPTVCCAEKTINVPYDVARLACTSKPGTVDLRAAVVTTAWEETEVTVLVPHVTVRRVPICVICPAGRPACCPAADVQETRRCPVCGHGGP
jgi:hypothetical protein